MKPQSAKAKGRNLQKWFVEKLVEFLKLSFYSSMIVTFFEILKSTLGLMIYCLKFYNQLVCYLLEQTINPDQIELFLFPSFKTPVLINNAPTYRIMWEKSSRKSHPS